MSAKIGRGDIVDQRAAERLVLADQFGGPGALLHRRQIGHQRAAHDVLDQPGLARHQLGQLPRRCDGQRRGAGKFAQPPFQHRKFRLARGQAGENVGDGDKVHRIAIAQEFEVQPVCVDQVGKGPAIAFLLGLAVIVRGKPAHVLADVLGLAPADVQVAAPEHEIHRAHVHQPARLVDHQQTGVNRPEQAFQRRTEAVFGGLPAGMKPAHLGQVAGG